MLRYIIIFFFLFMIGCENTDLTTATDAGMDALKAITLTDADILEIASLSVAEADRANTLALDKNGYSTRLNSITGGNRNEGGIGFNYRVYISPEVNAFAMADGSIRIYSGLMELMNDGELRFVVGHEMGHVVQKHIRKQIKLAYAASAVRKGLASQDSSGGDIARSLFGALSESLINAQFSQLEEKEADDYGLLFLKEKGLDPQSGVSALRKLAGLGNGHSFLSSHPAPDKRAERLQAQQEGRALSIEEQRQDFLTRIKGFISRLIAGATN
jgi:metalloprotease